MLKIIVKSLTGHRIRVFLTIVSIAGGVMVFVSLSALLQGLETSVYETFQKFSGERDILLVEGAADIDIPVERFCISTIEEVVYNEKKILVKHTDFDDFEKLNGVSVIEGGAPVPGECVVEYFFSQKEGIFLGDTIVTYTVVGIFLHEKGFYTHVITGPGEGYFITEIKVDPNQYDFAAEHIENAVPADTLSYFFSEGTQNLHKSLQQLLVVVVIVLDLSLVVSMNTAVLERKWEIGILRALGAQKFFILKLFLYEGIIISFAAAVLGLALGIIFSNSLTIFISEIQQVKGIQPILTGPVLVQALVGPLVIGVLGSIIPAYRAAGLDVTECLVV